MPTPDPIKAIAFDAYGTLFDVASIDLRLHHHFGDKAPALAGLWRRKQLEYTWLRTLMQRYRNFYALTHDALLYSCRSLELPIQDAVAEDLMAHYYQLTVYPEVPEALKTLKDTFQLAILSNANPGLLEKGAEYNELPHLFDGIFSVDPIAKFKPDPEVYSLAVTGLGIRAEELLFVSSNPWDVAGAKSAGLRVCWVMRKNSVMEELGFAPDVQVVDLKALAAWLMA